MLYRARATTPLAGGIPSLRIRKRPLGDLAGGLYRAFPEVRVDVMSELTQAEEVVRVARHSTVKLWFNYLPWP